MKPIIGIVGRSIKAEEFDTIYCTEAIRKAVIKHGGNPLVILPSQYVDYELIAPKDMDRLTEIEKNDLKQIIDLCDGIIIPGTRKLFEYDEFIYNYSKENNKSILCICGGMQLMGLIDNTTLIPNETDHNKKGEEYAHKVKIEEDTLLYKILNKNEIKVNSIHNYHVGEVSNLKISAYSSDGIIEALEEKNNKFILGVQWHPEAMIEYDEDANKIIKAFINSCK